MCIGWYDRTQWAKLKQVAVDGDELDDTYEDWLRNAERLERNLTREGFTVRRVAVNVDSLLAWCITQRIGLNAEARSKYAAELASGIG